MDILVYGASELFFKMLTRINEKYSDINVVGLIDSFFEGKRFGHDVELCTEDIKKKYSVDTPVVITTARRNIEDVVGRLEQLGYKKFYYYLNKTWSANNCFFESECIELSHIDFDSALVSIEMHVTDYCNLNCVGCAHFSPLFEKKDPDFDVRINDIYILRRLYDSLVFISLLGGEPLLNRDIDRYIIAVRKTFPLAQIEIVSNGLLIPVMEKSFFESLKKNSVTVVISEYEPTRKIITKITDILRKYEVDYAIRELDSKSTFNKPLSLNRNSMHERYCISQKCYAVCDGKIARCPTLLYIKRLNDSFGTDFPLEGIIDLSMQKKGADLKKSLRRKVPLCDYCIKNEVKWEQCKGIVRLEEFAVDE